MPRKSIHFQCGIYYLRIGENASKLCSTIIIDVSVAVVVLPLMHSIRINSRNSSSKIDVDNYDNSQTLYTNIKITSVHLVCQWHTLKSYQHQLYFAECICRLLLLLLLTSRCHCLVVCCIAVKFPVFYSFSRALSLFRRNTDTHNRTLRIEFMVCRWLIVDACVANILRLPVNSLR